MQLTDVATHVSAFIAGLAAAYAWARGVIGMFTPYEAQIMAELTHIKALLGLGAQPPQPIPPVPAAPISPSLGVAGTPTPATVPLTNAPQ